MDRLGSQALHCFLCSKNSQRFIWTHQSSLGWKAKGAWHYKNGACLGAVTLEHGEGWSRAIGQGGFHLASLLLLACLLALVWAFFTQIGPLFTLGNRATAGSVNRDCFPAVCRHVSWQQASSLIISTINFITFCHCNRMLYFYRRVEKRDQSLHFLTPLKTRPVDTDILYVSFQFTFYTQDYSFLIYMWWVRICIFCQTHFLQKRKAFVFKDCVFLNSALSTDL